MDSQHARDLVRRYPFLGEILGKGLLCRSAFSELLTGKCANCSLLSILVEIVDKPLLKSVLLCDGEDGFDIGFNQRLFTVTDNSVAEITLDKANISPFCGPDITSAYLDAGGPLDDETTLASMEDPQRAYEMYLTIHKRRLRAWYESYDEKSLPPRIGSALTGSEEYIVLVSQHQWVSNWTPYFTIKIEIRPAKGRLKDLINTYMEPSLSIGPCPAECDIAA